MTVTRANELPKATIVTVETVAVVIVEIILAFPSSDPLSPSKLHNELSTRRSRGFTSEGYRLHASADIILQKWANTKQLYQGAWQFHHCAERSSASCHAGAAWLPSPRKTQGARRDQSKPIAEMAEMIISTVSEYQTAHLTYERQQPQHL